MDPSPSQAHAVQLVMVSSNGRSSHTLGNLLNGKLSVIAVVAGADLHFTMSAEGQRIPDIRCLFELVSGSPDHMVLRHNLGLHQRETDPSIYTLVQQACTKKAIGACACAKVSTS